MGSEQTSSPSETTLHPVRVPVPEMLAARAVAAKPKKTPSITPERNRSMPCSMRTRINERFRPACLSCAKGELRRQYEQRPDKDTDADHERGDGIYPSEPHGTSPQGLATPVTGSNVAVIGAAQARAASWLLQCSNQWRRRP